MNPILAALSGWVTPNQLQQKIQTQLSGCAYSQGYIKKRCRCKYNIEKAALRICSMNQSFKSETYNDFVGHQMKKYLQIFGILQIPDKGKVTKIDFHVAFPEGFPTVPPKVYIVKRKEDHEIDPFYRDLKSPTNDMAYILNQKLTTINRWNSSSDICEIINEVINLMRTKIPFYKSPNVNPNSPWANLKDQHQKSSYPQCPSTYSYPNPYNQCRNPPIPSYQPQPGYPGFNNPYPYQQNQGYQHREPPIPFVPNQAPQGNFMQQGNFNSQNSQQQGFGFQAPGGFNFLATGQAYLVSTKQILSKLQREYQKALETVQKIEIISASYESQIVNLRKEIENLEEYRLKAELADSESDLVNFVIPANSASEQLLNLVAKNKAIEDGINLLEKQFCEEKVSLEETMRILKKIQEEKFYNQVLINKCIDAQKKF